MTTQRIKEMAQQIIAEAIEISATTEHDVFAEYSPHVNWIEVKIHPGGWKANIPYSANPCVRWGKNYRYTERDFERVMEILAILKDGRWEK